MGKGIYSLLFLIVLCASISARAVECRYDTMCVTLNFAQGESALDTAYASNAGSVRYLRSRLGGVDASSGAVRSVSVRGGASPEGGLIHNIELAARRADSGADFMSGCIPVARSGVNVLDSGVDWLRLRSMVDACSEDWRHEAVMIIDDVPELVYDDDDRIVDSRSRRLGMLRGGDAWRYMSRHFFPVMRNVDICIEVLSGTAAGNEVCQSPNTSPTDISGDTAYVAGARGEALHADGELGLPEAAADGGFRMLLKTNMLYDAAAVPNIGIEAAFGNDWSVGVNWMHAWWSRNLTHRYWRVYGGDVELRRWIHRNDRSTSHSGHHLGLYGQILSYDVEFGGRGRQSDGLNWGVGLAYGYSLPLSRYFNLDFTIGVGYLAGEYNKYKPVDDCYVWQETAKLNWWGPTKAEISLVWIIGGRRKGGKL